MALAQLQPAVRPAFNVQEAARLLQSYGRLIKQATNEEKKTFFATVLSEVFVENKKIVSAAVARALKSGTIKLFIRASFLGLS